MTEWLKTGKRKRSVGQQQQDDVAIESQDVLGMKPLKRARRRIAEEVLELQEEEHDLIRPELNAKSGGPEEDAIDESRVVRSALHPDECGELLYFIERNYLSSLSALMYSLKDLLFVAEPTSDHAQPADHFVAEFNRLRQMKDGIVKKAAAARRSTGGSAPGTPVRRRPSPYHIFMKEHAGLIREEHPDGLPFGGTSTLVAAKWKTMSDEEKAPYVQKAAEEAVTFAAEADEPSQTHKRATTAWQVFFGEQIAERKSAGLSRQELARSIGDDWKHMSEADRAKYVILAEERTSQPPTPRSTKRMAPGWAVFRKEQGKILREENPNMAAADRLKELHAQWDTLTDEQRAKYRETAEFAAAAGGRRRSNSTTATTRRSSTHVSSGVIAEAEGAVVVRSKRLNANAFLSLTRIPTVVLVDITLKSTSPYRKFAYAYPVGGIPLPLGRKEAFAMSVEGIFEGLKVFEKAGVDRSMLTNQSMKSLHRTEKKHGKLLGWSRGLKGHSDGDMLLNEENARWQILFPAYKFVLDECLQDEVRELQAMIKKGSQLVLLDMENSVDVYDYSRPVAAAELLRRYLLGQWPTRDEEQRLVKEAAEKGQAATEILPSKKSTQKTGAMSSKVAHDDDGEKVHWDSQVSLGEEEEKKDVGSENEGSEDSEEDSSAEDQSEDHDDDTMDDEDEDEEDSD